MIRLLDILKETDLRVRFTDQFKSSASREQLDRATIQRRLLLCLYGLGTNTGLKRMSGDERGERYSDLLYVRRRFITKDHLRAAIVQVVNAMLQTRLPHIWGEGSSACASDSKKFGAWDQNLMTEWHIRYRGPGIMVYWHVEKKSACIYSQLKSCSSSEVAAMIEGVLRHCTEMAVEKQYVDIIWNYIRCQSPAFPQCLFVLNAFVGALFFRERKAPPHPRKRKAACGGRTPEPPPSPAPPSCSSPLLSSRCLMQRNGQRRLLVCRTSGSRIKNVAIVGHCWW